MTAFDLFMKLHESLEDDQELITPHQFGLLMVDWTNPQKRARYQYLPLSGLKSHDGTVVMVPLVTRTLIWNSLSIFLWLYMTRNGQVISSVDPFASRISKQFPDEDQKVFCQLLGELHIMPGLDLRSIHKLHLLLHHHEQVNNNHCVSLSQHFERDSSNVRLRMMLWRKFLAGSRIAS